VSKYEQRKNAVDWLAERIKRHSNTTSEKASEQAAEIARKTDNKNDSTPKRKKG
jgi:hypothetical protein